MGVARVCRNRTASDRTGFALCDRQHFRRNGYQRAKGYAQKDPLRSAVVYHGAENGGAITPPILNPVMMKPKTLPNAPGGVTAPTIMSREG